MQIKQEAMEALRKKLQEGRYKMTPQRQTILQIFIDRPGEHLSAEDVHRVLQAKESGIGLATVYRSLELLYDMGFLQKMDFDDGKARYELNETDGAHQHHHLLCLRCGKVTAFDDDLLDDLERSIAEKSGFQIVDHQVKFYGHCRECREKRED